jgi:hypothetical protein
MKATSESTLSTDHRNHVTRRQALHGAAACGALALPAGAALAGVVDVDHGHGSAVALADIGHGLAQIEAGYARWQALEAEKDALRERRNDLWDRARADRPALTPEPEPDDFDDPTAWFEAAAHGAKRCRTSRGIPTTKPAAL